MSSNTVSFLLIFLTSFAVREINGQVGSECWSNSMCSYIWGRCLNFVCDCWEPKVPSVERNMCLIDLDSQCLTYSDECLDINAKCDSSFWCSCIDGFILNPETKYCVPHLTAKCDVGGLQCIDGSCTDGTCQCPEGKVPNTELSRCSIALGQVCTSADDVCSDPNAHCAGNNFGVCSCDVHYQQVTIEGAPFCGKVLGNRCTNTTECADDHALCEPLNHGFSTCNCQHGYVPSKNRDSCLAVSRHWPGTCQEDVQCSSMYGRYSTCQNNVCACTTGYTYEKDDFGCIPTHAAGIMRPLERIELLTKALLSYLPSDVRMIAEDALQALSEARGELEI